MLSTQNKLDIKEYLESINFNLRSGWLELIVGDIFSSNLDKEFCQIQPDNPEIKELEISNIDFSEDYLDRLDVIYRVIKILYINVYKKLQEQKIKYRWLVVEKECENYRIRYKVVCGI